MGTNIYRNIRNCCYYCKFNCCISDKNYKETEFHEYGTHIIFSHPISGALQKQTIKILNQIKRYR